MAHIFLLEIGLEEMPAHVVTPAIKQLVKRTADYLKEQRIAYDDIKPFSTPRRLAIQIDGLADKQEDISESVKGPAKKIAQDADGNWTKAAIGFTRGQGLTPDDITFKEIKGTEYVYVDKFIAGEPVAEVLAGLKDIITAMTFPTMMKWSTHHFEYIRPIRWLVALLDADVIPFSILDVTTGRNTRGHRFLGTDIDIATAADYEADLTTQFVIADADKRKALIKKQIEKIASDHDWTVTIDAGLLEEVNNLVEWPTAFEGSFDKKYLTIPEEVLITSMRDHQRFFYARDAKGKLLPNFISVRNGTDHDLQNVVAGNEKVLTARLEDAMFFYTEDQKKTIADYVERLKSVSFHDKISTMAEKMARVTAIVGVLAKHFNLNDAQTKAVVRASEIYKFDLVTGMVGEFAELQGVMGEKYALLQGEDPAVAQAIREHYEPISADGALPTSVPGAVLALADKFDSIMTFFAAGMIPSGSNDPYALRRQATGIVRIAQDQQWSLPVAELASDFITAEDTAHVAPQLDQASQIDAMVSFIKDRIRKILRSAKQRHDIIDAVTAGSSSDVLQIFTAAQLLADHADDANFKDVIESLTRVIRLAQKAPAELATATVNSDLFENDSEGALHQGVAEVAAAAEKGLADLYASLVAIQPTIAAYFEATMVMAKDDAIRNNRLTELSHLATLALTLGDLDQLIVK
ncbi:MAG: glycine--tRNA ligase subunit beta [Levilactobacillus sp.]|jgi:glycyl-tRNA synthetase beta chain|uniref:glycine--tRNA ligase subunit beta n=1 Tax=Levilactobacillus sp. TaxID=2767919 RepID=UPI0025902500|nr:glycine--tRNA ligase subunit beta [Levilactobacillus sp.]MCH4123286.1 glycine--tRNA ligase subunit beta [Levilactobacillus sp.]MCI1552576.1 glycine--tRNA ligase subunit beta [Levilactobacillus sp.]MCI1599311.1 glycine--tRNA ligase subunit beta [Levilactobacillus sp.]MCI1606736.1 glycine--tRNA ligase subunit beta [Levilactobacillus sp.]